MVPLALTLLAIAAIPDVQAGSKAWYVHTSSSYLEPAHDIASLQELLRVKDVVVRVPIDDPVTGRGASSETTYEGLSKDAVMRGFRSFAIHDAWANERFSTAPRLFDIRDAVSGLVTTLHYDVDDQLVREERGASVIRRFQGHRRGPDAAMPGLVSSEPVLSNVRLLIGPDGRPVWRYTLQDVDGRSVLTWSMSGSDEGALKEVEVTGLYGVALEGASGGAWSSGELLEIDGLHGSDPDRTNEVVHFGARHMLHRDGMWMQPEPLLYTPRVQGMLGSPGAFGRQYAAGNPILLADDTGRLPVILSTLLGCPAPAAAPLLVGAGAGAGAGGGGSALAITGTGAVAVTAAEVQGGVMVATVAAVVATMTSDTLSSDMQVSASVQDNREAGKAWEDEVKAELEADGWEVSSEVTLEAPGGERTRVDHVATKEGEATRLIEAKSSGTAPLTKGQKAAHPAISTSGATVKGRGKPNAPGGTKLPPTEVEVVRPD